MARRTIGFFAGLAYLRRGARFVYVDHRELAKFWLAPVFLSALLLLLGAYFALHEHARVAAAIWAGPDSDGVVGVLHTAFEWLVALVLLSLSLLAVTLLSNLIAAPFNDALSEAVERLRRGQTARGFSLHRLLLDLGRSLALELGKLAIFLGLMAPLFVLNLALPVVFSPIYALAGPCLTALFLAIDYMDWAAGRRELSVRERFMFAFAHLRAVLGFGLAIELLLFVPLLNLLFMPAAVAGATLLFLELDAEHSTQADEAR